MAARKTYCFTYNNYTAVTEVALQKFLVDNCDYACYGRELAPTTGTPHLQVLVIYISIYVSVNMMDLGILNIQKED